MTTPEQLTIEANGLTFGALAWGDPDAPLALLVHGYPDTAWTWRHVGPLLAAQGWRVVAPFTRGYAPTDLAPDDRYCVADLADDVLALHTALGGDARAVLVGHDWGAVTTYAVTAKAPDRFARYVALAVPPASALLAAFRRRSTLPMALRQLGLSWYFTYNQVPHSAAALERTIARLWKAWSPAWDAREDLAHVNTSLGSRERQRAALRYYRNNLQGGAKALFTTRPGAPVLYVQGSDDGCIQAGIGSAFPDLLAPGSRVEVLTGAGHFLQLEAPDRVNELISEWIGIG